MQNYIYFCFLVAMTIEMSTTDIPPTNNYYNVMRIIDTTVNRTVISNIEGAPQKLLKWIDIVCDTCFLITQHALFWLSYLGFTLLEPILCSHYPEVQYRHNFGSHAINLCSAINRDQYLQLKLQY